MPRPRNTIPTRPLEIAIPQPLREALDKHLFSDVLERIPQGSYSQFIGGLIRDFFNHGFLDLAPFIPGTQPGVYVVRGPRTTLDALARALKGED